MCSVSSSCRSRWAVPIFGPPGIPADRLKALRDAFQAFTKDAQVLAEAQKTQTEIFRPMSGEDMTALVERLHKVFAGPPEEGG